MFEKLKNRWNIKSNFQVVVILIVFAITGSTTVYVQEVIFGLVGITSATHLWIRIPLYILIILPVYNVLLLIVGFLLGQFKFFLDFEKRFFSRFLFRKKTTTVVNES